MKAKNIKEIDFVTTIHAADKVFNTPGYRLIALDVLETLIKDRIKELEEFALKDSRANTRFIYGRQGAIQELKRLLGIE